MIRHKQNFLVIKENAAFGANPAAFLHHESTIYISDVGGIVLWECFSISRFGNVVRILIVNSAKYKKILDQNRFPRELILGQRFPPQHDEDFRHIAKKLINV